jgi:hypothetical protein
MLKKKFRLPDPRAIPTHGPKTLQRRTTQENVEDNILTEQGPWGRGGNSKQIGPGNSSKEGLQTKSDHSSLKTSTCAQSLPMGRIGSAKEQFIAT